MPAAACEAAGILFISDEIYTELQERFVWLGEVTGVLNRVVLVRTESRIAAQL